MFNLLEKMKYPMFKQKFKLILIFSPVVFSPVEPTPPVFEKPPSAGRFVEGEDARLECKVTANPEPEVKWKRRGRFLQNDNK